MSDLTLKTRVFCSRWLTVVIFILLCIILVGGVTRLTDSGLSMTEWKPILGSIPPLNDIEWNVAFDKYKAYPEFKLIKSDMDLSGFKFIFFWEYFHRILGRLIGLVFFFPFIYLVIRKRLNGYWSSRFLLGLVLGGSQGLLGWYMVKSGLADMPDVSHYRLAAHFTLALFIMVYLYSLLLKLKHDSKLFMQRRIPFFKSFIVLLIIQIFYGAFVAGLDAGIGYNTFPLMGESFIPKGLFTGHLIHKMIDTTVGVQFVHRILGFILLGFGIYYFFKSISLRTMRSTLFPLSLMIFIQFLLGVSTILLKVPVGMASMHQMGACVLVLLVTRAYFYQESKIS